MNDSRTKCGVGEGEGEALPYYYINYHRMVKAEA